MCCSFSHEVSWMRSWTQLSQFLRVFLPTFTWILDTCISYNEDRYSTKLQWKDDPPPLPTNYDVSLKRTESMIRRLRKEPFLLRKYGEIISEEKERGFIETVDDSVVPSHQIHYIPHQGVQKDSVTPHLYALSTISVVMKELISPA